MKENFSWSLNPLSTCLQFAGIPLKWSTKKENKSTIKALIFLVAIVTANFVINGPRGIEISRFEFMEEREFHSSSFTYLKLYPFAIVKLVGIIADKSRVAKSSSGVGSGYWATSRCGLMVNL